MKNSKASGCSSMRCRLATALLLVSILQTPLLGASPKERMAAPYTISWQDDEDALVAKILTAGVTQPAERVSLDRYLLANRPTLDRIVELSMAPRLVTLTGDPDLKTLRQAARALAARGVLSESTGNVDGAIGDWLAVVRLGSATARGVSGKAPLLSLVMGYGIEGTGVEALLQWTGKKLLDRTIASRILEAMERRAREGMPTLAQAVKAEYSILAREVLLSGNAKAIDSAWKDAGLPDEVLSSERARTLQQTAPKLKEYFDRLAGTVAAGTEPPPMPASTPPGMPLVDQAYVKLLRSVVPDTGKARKVSQEAEFRVDQLIRIVRRAVETGR